MYPLLVILIVAKQQSVIENSTLESRDRGQGEYQIEEGRETSTARASHRVSTLTSAVGSESEPTTTGLGSRLSDW